ncbi:hypothetical protein LCGC14_3102880 [marine sediment metagenome]|uniref:Uncharacterized protein n=1 Tax=marine sediment metagenome TaxID=412755 RepID=A0A0F8YER0_9ZZZZ
MAKRNILTSMSAVEKRFTREFVEDCLKPHGIARKFWPEYKRDALGRFRRAAKTRAALLADEAVDSFIASTHTVYHGPEAKRK